MVQKSANAAKMGQAHLYMEHSERKGHEQRQMITQRGHAFVYANTNTFFRKTLKRLGVFL